MATRYIDYKEMQKLTGKSKSTLWRMYAKRNEFPKPDRTKSGVFLGWSEEVYEAWVKEKKE
ncbi:helix-turn-helix transcriptional regulator [Xenorhabdus griffiniae]|uniref:AlpA family phage regulatory protein n=1 Tax=Xenorhabdus griffiniae TaxID=351672 RepID=A0ABY9XFN9_9GAMM|nr:AlpA family phage regulatory protein [Xenorhabdus griffiniae]MBD1227713.1 AlpA family phage regulatory protein [Xenorhabdus griffiniae]MBE8587034.1 AlpA family phage regulatory protein [Xenorhabdus griffiniae]WMV71699.1 AlpA family phage regulatory protein [Xenorhabdus griffiniae]WNH01376.1 AlpA family phage regulatory protein [Xenorhabdus griffiniae]